MSKPICLIVEPNPYHGEILPGFTKYFQDIGYDVELLCNPGAIEDNPFVLYPRKEMPKILTLNPQEMAKYLCTNECDRYDIIFFSTNVYWEQEKNYSSWAGYAGKLPKNHNTIMVEHNMSYLDFDAARALYYQHRIVTLLDYTSSKYQIPNTMVNPHYFGDVKSGVSGDKVTITIVGSSSLVRENLELLFDAVRRCSSKDRKKMKIQIIGKKPTIPDDLKDSFITLGRLSYKELYESVAASHYLMTLFDSNLDVQVKYSQGTTSGSVQLSLGFSLPLISTSAALSSYRLIDEGVAIPYEEGDSDSLFQCITKAVRLNHKEYKRMVEQTSILARIISDRSKNNLEEIIQSLKITEKKNRQYADELTLILADNQNEIQQLKGEVDELKKDGYYTRIAKDKLSERIHELEYEHSHLTDELEKIKKSKRYQLITYISRIKRKLKNV